VQLVNSCQICCCCATGCDWLYCVMAVHRHTCLVALE